MPPGVLLTELESARCRLRYDELYHHMTWLVEHKPTRWSASRPIDGITDFLEEHDLGTDQVDLLGPRVDIQSRAFWRCCVGLRSTKTQMQLQRERDQDVRTVSKWINLKTVNIAALRHGIVIKERCGQYYGLDRIVTYDNGPLGGSMPSSAHEVHRKRSTQNTAVLVHPTEKNGKRSSMSIDPDLDHDASDRPVLRRSKRTRVDTPHSEDTLVSDSDMLPISATDVADLSGSAGPAPAPSDMIPDTSSTLYAPSTPAGISAITSEREIMSNSVVIQSNAVPLFAPSSTVGSVPDQGRRPLFPPAASSAGPSSNSSHSASAVSRQLEGRLPLSLVLAEQESAKANLDRACDDISTFYMLLVRLRDGGAARDVADKIMDAGYTSASVDVHPSGLRGLARRIREVQKPASRFRDALPKDKVRYILLGLSTLEDEVTENDVPRELIGPVAGEDLKPLIVFDQEDALWLGLDLLFDRQSATLACWTAALDDLDIILAYVRGICERGDPIEILEIMVEGRAGASSVRAVAMRFREVQDDMPKASLGPARKLQYLLTGQE